MKRFIRTVLICLPTLMLIGLAVPAPVSAACGSGNTPKDQILTGADETGNTDCTGKGVTDLAKSVINILSIVVGIAAVIMVIYAGFKYVTAAGDSNGISSAKTTLIYALVGLVIAALAQFLVHFVLNAAEQAATPKGKTAYSWQTDLIG